MSRLAATPPLLRPAPVLSEYPLQGSFLVAGVVVGTLLGVLLQAWAAGLLFLSLLWITGLTWRRSEPPIMPFCLAYQWLFVAAPYFAWLLGIQTRQSTQRVDPSDAATLAALGYVALALGMRAIWAVLARSMAKASARPFDQGRALSSFRLFWVVILLNAVNWLYYIQPRQISFGFSQLIYAVLAMRLSLFVLLWQLIVRQRRGLRRGLIALTFVLIPMLASTMSGFKVLFFMIFVLIVGEIRLGQVRRLNLRQRRLAILAGALVSGLVAIGVVWQGAVKPVWRTTVVEGDTITHVQKFIEVSGAAIGQLDWATGAGSLLERIGSIDQFARVLRRVPALIPHEHGRLSGEAVRHVLVPRFLDPDKPALDSSAMTRRYAGIAIGGLTSIGIGYMAQFYVDFGVPGMFAAIFFYGILIGFLYAALVLWAPAAYVTPLLLVLFVDGFDGFESDLAKQFGGLLMKTVIFLLLAATAGRMLLRFLRDWQPRQAPAAAR